jgi:plasmid stabilization system protein ParE
MSELEFLPVARIEYANAFDWYLQRSVRAANRFVSEVEAAIDEIRRDPERFARWDETYRYRQLATFPYFIAYRLHDDEIVIVAIRHAAQDQDAWKGR